MVVLPTATNFIGIGGANLTPGQRIAQEAEEEEARLMEILADEEEDAIPDDGAVEANAGSVYGGD